MLAPSIKICFSRQSIQQSQQHTATHCNTPERKQKAETASHCVYRSAFPANLYSGPSLVSLVGSGLFLFSCTNRLRGGEAWGLAGEGVLDFCLSVTHAHTHTHTHTPTHSLSVSLSLCLSVCLSVCLSLRLSVCLSVSLSVCLPV